MVNNVVIIGRLAATPVLKETNDGVKVTSFTVVCDRPRVNKNGERDADFISVTAWRNSAEFVCKNFNKGDYISVTGSLQTKLRQRKDDEDKSYKVVEVVADRCDFCGYKRPPKPDEE